MVVCGWVWGMRWAGVAPCTACGEAVGVAGVAGIGAGVCAVRGRQGGHLLQLDRAPAETDCLGVGLTMGVALCCTTGAESGTLSPRSSEIRFHLRRGETA